MFAASEPTRGARLADTLAHTEDVDMIDDHDVRRIEAALAKSDNGQRELYRVLAERRRAMPPREFLRLGAERAGVARCQDSAMDEADGSSERRLETKPIQLAAALFRSRAWWA
jgi:hypothetical protein